MSRHNNRGRDVPDTGLLRISYHNFDFSSNEVEEKIQCERDEQVRGSVNSLRPPNNDTEPDNTTDDDSTTLNMEEDEDDPRDVSDAKLLHQDQSDLADLARQNGGITGQVRVVKTWPPVYTKLDLAFSIISLVMFAVDLGTDIALVVRYHLTRQYVLRNLTLGFILVPAVVSGAVSVVWSYIDYRNHASHNRSKRPMVIRCLFTFFQLGRVYRMLEFIYRIYCTWKEQDEEKRKDISHKAIEQKRDAAILSLVDGFLESTFQLLLQLFLVIRSIVSLDELRVLALLSSWVSTALTVTSYYRTVRRAVSDRRNIRYGPSAIYMACRLFELGPRFLLLGLCVSYFHNILIGGVALHVILAFIMYIAINPRLTGVCEGQICRAAFLLLVSFISVFCFINLKDGKTLWTMLLYYGMFYLENFIMMAVVVYLTKAGIVVYSPWYNTAFSVIPGLLLHMLCLVAYYKFFHPQKAMGKDLSRPGKYCKTEEQQGSLENNISHSHAQSQGEDTAEQKHLDSSLEEITRNQYKSSSEELYRNNFSEDDLSSKTFQKSFPQLVHQQSLTSSPEMCEDKSSSEEMCKDKSSQEMCKDKSSSEEMCKD
ncbi:XK-related protein 6-like [Pecten maximus]|uniref:XK-related protein 6-like n=1 Tax=Pecten maximus TaxID=6579 RepID=UPI0014582924|nr:XK-related protein 6-like [Pecten maximus]